MSATDSNEAPVADQMSLQFGAGTKAVDRSDKARDDKIELPKTKSETKPKKSAPRSKASKQTTAERMAGQQREISVSEFFAKNRHLLGFDNKRKALLTTVKEAVDNSMDACEEARILPELHVSVSQLAEDRYRVDIRDNGPGIVKSQIPNIFGKLLYGSKFHRLKMCRGQQGIGISAAGMYGLITTGQPISIISRTSRRAKAHHYKLAIDTKKNRPDIVHEDEVDVDWAHGTEVSIDLVASYVKGKQGIDEYLEQTAIANPHAQISFENPMGERRVFTRGSDELPVETREIKPHPHGIELGVLMKMLKESDAQQLGGFMQREFSRVSPTVCRNVCAQSKLTPRTWLKQIDSHAAERIYKAFQSVKMMAPSTDCLSPIGTRQILAGLLKGLKAEFYTASSRSPTVYRGNPFQVEVGLAFGGGLPSDQQARLIRFANRVPLLYQQSHCAVYKSVLESNWRSYGVQQSNGALPSGPLVIMVHFASVWVPFTSESKEAIADYDEIRKEVGLAVRECARKLQTFIRRRRRTQREGERRSVFFRYIPEVSAALSSVVGVDRDAVSDRLMKIARTRTEMADRELDEHGKIIKKRRDASESDDTVIIVERGSAEQGSAESDLFDQDDHRIIGSKIGKTKKASVRGRASRLKKTRRTKKR
jgi:DNA topoisomerase VI subunit B